jgi:calcineurin-like phosphoesterase family protein
MGPIDESLALVSRMNGHKHLIAGNHDRCFEGYGDNRVNKVQHDEWIRRYRAAGFATIATGAHIRRNGFGTLVGLRLDETDRNRLVTELCHFPTYGESELTWPDRFTEYRPRSLSGRDRRGQTRRWVVCGHVHNAWLTAGRNVNVGVDAWRFTPVHQDHLAALIDEREAEFGSALDDVATITPIPPREV